jgi:chitin synthase
MFFFHVQALYNAFNLVFTWFSLANLWLTFSIVIKLLSDVHQANPFFIFGTSFIVSPLFPDAAGSDSAIS